MKRALTLRNQKAYSSAIKAVSALAILLPVVLAFLYVRQFGVNVVFHDQWAELPLFGRLSSGGLELSDLFAPHNEHRIFFPRIVILLLGVATAYNTVAEMYFMQACTLVTLVVFWLAFRNPRGESNLYRLLLFVPVAFMLFTLRQYSSTLQGIQIMVAMGQTFAVLAFYCLHLSRQERLRKFAFPAALVSGTVTSFSFLQGLFVWPVGLLQLLFTPMQRSAKRVLVAVWTLVGAGEWFLYLFNLPGGDRSLGYVFLAPVKAAQYLLILSGGSLFWSLSPALLTGLFLLVLAAVALVLAYRGGGFGGYAFWFAVLLFAVLFIVVVTAGRVEQFGVPQAIASRYVNWTILLPISVYVILAKLALERRDVLSKSLFGALAALIVLSMPISYAYGVQAGIRERESREMDAFILSTYRSQPDEVLVTLSPQLLPAQEKGQEALDQAADRVRQRARLLERLDYNVFSGTSQPQQLPRPAELSRLSEPDSSASATVVSIDNMRVSDPDNPVAVSKEEGFVNVSGRITDGEAGGVYIQLDGRRFPAFHGSMQGSAGAPASGDSEFEARLPLFDVEPGTHELSLLVLTRDREAYHTVSEAGTIEVNSG